MDKCGKTDSYKYKQKYVGLLKVAGKNFNQRRNTLTSTKRDASRCVTRTSSLWATPVSDPIWFSSTNIPDHGKTASVTQSYSSWIDVQPSEYIFVVSTKPLRLVLNCHYHDPPMMAKKCYHYKGKKVLNFNALINFHCKL